MDNPEHGTAEPHSPHPIALPAACVAAQGEENLSSPPLCVDLFAGAGGFSLAARRTKALRVVAAVENDRHACATYRRNLAGPTLYERDIRELDPQILVDAHFSEGRVCDIVLGGPPCQGFSVHRIKNAGVNDARNALILRYFEFVAALRPKVFLMENVPGITGSRHCDYLEAFYRVGQETGYDIQRYETLDARDYGVPQRRRRVFILGVRADVAFDLTHWPPPPTHGDEKARRKNPQLAPWLNASEVFDKPFPPNDENDLHMRHSPKLVEVFRSTPLNGSARHQSNRVLPCHENYGGHSDVYGRIAPDRPGPTMTAACISPSKGRFVHPTEHHGITLRQAARFQDFPDDFVFEGGLMAAGAQIGNAVPIRLGIALLQSVLKGLGIAFES